MLLFFDQHLANILRPWSCDAVVVLGSEAEVTPAVTDQRSAAVKPLLCVYWPLSPSLDANVATNLSLTSAGLTRKDLISLRSLSSRFPWTFQLAACPPPGCNTAEFVWTDVITPGRRRQRQIMKSQLSRRDATESRRSLEFLVASRLRRLRFRVSSGNFLKTATIQTNNVSVARRSAVSLPLTSSVLASH